MLLGSRTNQLENSSWLTFEPQEVSPARFDAQHPGAKRVVQSEPASFLR